MGTTRSFKDWLVHGLTTPLRKVAQFQQWVAASVQKIPGWAEIEAAATQLTWPLRSLAAWSLERMPFLHRYEWLFETKRLATYSPVLLAGTLAFMALRGLMTTSLGHIGTDMAIYPALAIVSGFNPFLGCVSALVFGAGDLVQKLIVNDIYGTPQDLVGHYFNLDYWGSMLGYIVGYGAPFAMGLLPGVASRAARHGARIALRKVFYKQAAAAAEGANPFGQTFRMFARRRPDGQVEWTAATSAPSEDWIAQGPPITRDEAEATLEGLGSGELRAEAELPADSGERFVNRWEAADESESYRLERRTAEHHQEPRERLIHRAEQVQSGEAHRLIDRGAEFADPPDRLIHRVEPVQNEADHRVISRGAEPSEPAERFIDRVASDPYETAPDRFRRQAAPPNERQVPPGMIDGGIGDDGTRIVGMPMSVAPAAGARPRVPNGMIDGGVLSDGTQVVGMAMAVPRAASRVPQSPVAPNYKDPATQAALRGLQDKGLLNDPDAWRTYRDANGQPLGWREKQILGNLRGRRMLKDGNDAAIQNLLRNPESMDPQVSLPPDSQAPGGGSEPPEDFKPAYRSGSPGHYPLGELAAAVAGGGIATGVVMGGIAPGIEWVPFHSRPNPDYSCFRLEKDTYLVGRAGSVGAMGGFGGQVAEVLGKPVVPPRGGGAAAVPGMPGGSATMPGIGAVVAPSTSPEAQAIQERIDRIHDIDGRAFGNNPELARDVRNLLDDYRETGQIDPRALADIEGRIGRSVDDYEKNWDQGTQAAVDRSQKLYGADTTGAIGPEFGKQKDLGQKLSDTLDRIAHGDLNTARGLGLDPSAVYNPDGSINAGKLDEFINQATNAKIDLLKDRAVLTTATAATNDAAATWAGRGEELSRTTRNLAGNAIGAVLTGGASVAAGGGMMGIAASGLAGTYWGTFTGAINAVSDAGKIDLQTIKEGAKQGGRGGAIGGLMGGGFGLLGAGMGTSLGQTAINSFVKNAPTISAVLGGIGKAAAANPTLTGGLIGGTISKATGGSFAEGFVDGAIGAKLGDAAGRMVGAHGTKGWSKPIAWNDPKAALGRPSNIAPPTGTAMPKPPTWTQEPIAGPKFGQKPGWRPEPVAGPKGRGPIDMPDSPMRPDIDPRTGTVVSGDKPGARAGQPDAPGVDPRINQTRRGDKTLQDILDEPAPGSAKPPAQKSVQDLIDEAGPAPQKPDTDRRDWGDQTAKDMGVDVPPDMAPPRGARPPVSSGTPDVPPQRADGTIAGDAPRSTDNVPEGTPAAPRQDGTIVGDAPGSTDNVRPGHPAAPRADGTIVGDAPGSTQGVRPGTPAAPRAAGPDASTPSAPPRTPDADVAPPPQRATPPPAQPDVPPQRATPPPAQPDVPPQRVTPPPAQPDVPSPSRPAPAGDGAYNPDNLPWNQKLPPEPPTRPVPDSGSYKPDELPWNKPLQDAPPPPKPPSDGPRVGHSDAGVPDWAKPPERGGHVKPPDAPVNPFGGDTPPPPTSEQPWRTRFPQDPDHPHGDFYKDPQGNPVDMGPPPGTEQKPYTNPYPPPPEQPWQRRHDVDPHTLEPIDRGPSPNAPKPAPLNPDDLPWNEQRKYPPPPDADQPWAKNPDAPRDPFTGDLVNKNPDGTPPGYEGPGYKPAQYPGGVGEPGWKPGQRSDTLHTREEWADKFGGGRTQPKPHPPFDPDAHLERQAAVDNLQNMPREELKERAINARQAGDDKAADIYQEALNRNKQPDIPQKLPPREADVEQLSNFPANDLRASADAARARGEEGTAKLFEDAIQRKIDKRPLQGMGDQVGPATDPTAPRGQRVDFDKLSDDQLTAMERGLRGRPGHEEAAADLAQRLKDRGISTDGPAPARTDMGADTLPPQRATPPAATDDVAPGKLTAAEREAKIAELAKEDPKKLAEKATEAELFSDNQDQRDLIRDAIKRQRGDTKPPIPDVPADPSIREAELDTLKDMSRKELEARKIVAEMEGDKKTSGLIDDALSRNTDPPTPTAPFDRERSLRDLSRMEMDDLEALQDAARKAGNTRDVELYGDAIKTKLDIDDQQLAADLATQRGDLAEAQSYKDATKRKLDTVFEDARAARANQPPPTPEELAAKYPHDELKRREELFRADGDEDGARRLAEAAELKKPTIEELKNRRNQLADAGDEAGVKDVDEAIKNKSKFSAEEQAKQDEWVKKRGEAVANAKAEKAELAAMTPEERQALADREAKALADAERQAREDRLNKLYEERNKARGGASKPETPPAKPQEQPADFDAETGDKWPRPGATPPSSPPVEKPPSELADFDAETGDKWPRPGATPPSSPTVEKPPSELADFDAETGDKWPRPGAKADDAPPAEPSSSAESVPEVAPSSPDLQRPPDTPDVDAPASRPDGPDKTPPSASTMPFTEADADVLRQYTGNEFIQMNAAMRSGDPDAIARFQTKIDQGIAALEKLPPEPPGTVYRGVNMSDAAAARYAPGETVTENYFMSTSKDAGGEFVGNTKFIIDAKSGRDVSPFSPNPEAEVLIPPGKDFRVKEVYTDYEGKRVIVMEEL